MRGRANGRVRRSAEAEAGSGATAAEVFEVGVLRTPIGKLHLAATGGVLRVLAFEEAWPRRRASLEARGARLVSGGGDLRPFRDALERYFEGEIEALGSLSAEPWGTPFQRRVWSALRRIPAGRTCSYGELAARIGRPAASRAVGAANGANPVAVVLPCHRVVGSDGRLTGYGGGMSRKRWLLAHEGVALAGDRLLRPLRGAARSFAGARAGA